MQNINMLKRWKKKTNRRQKVTILIAEKNEI